MFTTTLILIVSTGLLLFYFQAVCERILRRPFAQEFYQSIVNANGLEYPSIRKALEEFDGPVEYARLKVTLRCDFLILKYLLKNATNVRQRYTCEERLLILYFRIWFVSLVTRHILRWRENAAAIKLTAILHYFANIVGERVNRVRFGDMTTSDFFNI